LFPQELNDFARAKVDQQLCTVSVTHGLQAFCSSQTFAVAAEHATTYAAEQASFFDLVGPFYDRMRTCAECHPDATIMYVRAS
jgi:hypothetical protein